MDIALTAPGLSLSLSLSLSPTPASTKEEDEDEEVVLLLMLAAAAYIDIEYLYSCAIFAVKSASCLSYCLTSFETCLTVICAMPASLSTETQVFS